MGGDISIIYRQIQTGHKQGIPDMLGLDQDSRICIIELKNVEANEDILPQALGYAMWAETNPDSIKAIWLESKQKPEEIQMDWDNLDIRVMLLAPSFKSTVPRMAGKIGYPIDLIQVRRYSFQNEEFLRVEVLENKPMPKIVTTKAQGTWDWAYYEAEHGKAATAQFRRAVETVAALVKAENWDIEYNLNKYYVGFKLGARVVFSVTWGGTNVWKLTLKLPQGVAEGFKGQHWEFQRYDNEFHDAVLRALHPETPDITELKPFFIAAYTYIVGIK